MATGLAAASHTGLISAEQRIVPNRQRFRQAAVSGDGRGRGSISPFPWEAKGLDGLELPDRKKGVKTYPRRKIQIQ